jgi:hypothetical protein
LKQYGCTEANDLQVRDGTRYLMRLFHADGDSWLAHTDNRLSAAASNYEQRRPLQDDAQGLDRDARHAPPNAESDRAAYIRSGGQALADGAPISRFDL